MNLEVSYFSESKKILKETNELFGTTPFTVSIDKSHIQPIGANLYITILDESSFRLTASQKRVSFYNYVDNQIVSEDNVLEIDTICKFNEPINNRMLRFSVALNKDFPVKRSEAKYHYYFKFNHLDYLAKGYLKQLQIEKASPLASIINVKFSENNLNKTITFLNRYLSSFLEENLAKKNNMASKTVNFIACQIRVCPEKLQVSKSGYGSQFSGSACL
jgi:hypothetical protein